MPGRRTVKSSTGTIGVGAASSEASSGGRRRPPPWRRARAAASASPERRERARSRPFVNLRRGAAGGEDGGAPGGRGEALFCGGRGGFGFWADTPCPRVPPRRVGLFPPPPP